MTVYKEVKYMKNEKLYLIFLMFLSMALITSCIQTESEFMYSLYKSGRSSYFGYYNCDADTAFSCAITALKHLGYEISEIDEKQYRIYGRKWEKYAKLYDIDDYTAATVEVEYDPILEISKVTLFLVEVKEGIRRVGYYEVIDYEHYKPFLDELDRLIDSRNID